MGYGRKKPVDEECHRGNRAIGTCNLGNYKRAMPTSMRQDKRSREGSVHPVKRGQERPVHHTRSIEDRSVSQNSDKSDHEDKRLQGSKPKGFQGSKPVHPAKCCETHTMHQVRDHTTIGPRKIDTNQLLNTSLEIEDLILEQQKDEDIQRMWSMAQGKSVQKPTARELVVAKDLRKIAGVIVKNERRETGEFRAKAVIPKSLQRRVVEDAHHLSHAGILGTYRILQQNCWFRKMKTVVKDVVKHCHECIAVRERPTHLEVMASDIRQRSL